MPAGVCWRSFPRPPHPPQVDALLEYRGFEIFERLFAEGRGCGGVGHLGIWELLAAPVVARDPDEPGDRSLRAGAMPLCNRPGPAAASPRLRRAARWRRQRCLATRGGGGQTCSIRTCCPSARLRAFLRGGASTTPAATLMACEPERRDRRSAVNLPADAPTVRRGPFDLPSQGSIARGSELTPSGWLPWSKATFGPNQLSGSGCTAVEDAAAAAASELPGSAGHA